MQVQQVLLHPTVVPISIRMDAKCFGIEVQIPSFFILPRTDDLLDFEDAYDWGSLAKGLDTVVADPSILFRLLPITCRQLPCSGGLYLSRHSMYC